jgi:DNA polymerase III epsilon subunit-like protein
MKFLCIDTETSGLDPATCEILELSYQPWENFTRGSMTSETFRALGNTDHPDFASAAKINGYTEDNRKGSVVFAARHLAACFAAIDANDGMVVGANPAFDWGFLHTAAARLRVPLPKSRVRLIDVSSLAVPMVAAGKVEGLSLRQLVKMVGKNQGEVHSSKLDVELTIDVFEHLCRAYVKALVTP